jgi:subtilisin family serine protease
MARYVMANRRAGKFLEVEKRASRAAVAAGFNQLSASVDVIADRNPADELARRVIVFEAEPEEIAAKAAALPTDCIVEAEILHFPLGQTLERRPGARIVGLRSSTVLDLSAIDEPLTAFTAMVSGSGAPLFGAEAILFLRDKFTQQSNITQIADRSGTVSFAVPAGHQALALVILPAGGHWSMVVRSPTSGAAHECPPFADVGALDWWHNQLGLAQFDPSLGTGIKVGVIDTGVGPNGCLAHVIDVGAFIDGTFDANGGADVDSHGSHVCGTIGARPIDPSHRAGIAAGVSLFCARVFPPDEGASQGDIANAIDELSRERGVDLINMSLGAASGSRIELDAIQDALQRGTLCVCAAGNDGGAVAFPAAFPEVVAVSAVGLKGAAPTGSLSATRLPTDPDKHGAGDLFLAEFSNFGNQVDCAAPGVGIISTVPERFDQVQPYAVMDGTSMASPAACGALAALLASSPGYHALTGSARAEAARTMLRNNAQSIGLSTVFQGAGMPQVP